MADYIMDLNGKVTRNKKKKKEMLPRVNKDTDIGPVKQMVSDGNIGPALPTPVPRDRGHEFYQKTTHEYGEPTEKKLEFLKPAEKGTPAQNFWANAGRTATGIGMGFSRVFDGVVQYGKYRIADIYDLLGDDEFADIIRYETENEGGVADLIKIADDKLAPYSNYGKTIDSFNQGMGQVMALLYAGKYLKKSGASQKTVQTGVDVLMGTSVSGSATTEALKDGATYDEAQVYGLLSGTSAVITEKIFGGLGKSVNVVGFNKGLTTFDDMVANALTSKIQNVLLKNSAQLAVKGIFEGSEEVIDGFANAVWKELTYKSEEDFWKILEDENLLEQFIVGVLTSYGAQSVDAIKLTKQGQDYVTGFTENEQKVVDAVYQELIQEREANGQKLTGREKSKLYDETVSAMDKGYIGIDSIEKVLGGDTYKAYTDEVANSEAIKKEYEELGKVTQPTLAQTSRYAELEKMVKDPNATSKQKQLKAQLGTEVYELVKGTKLAESYNEDNRRRQVFKADLTQYSPKQQEVVRMAMESGVLNNTNRTHEFVDLIAKISENKGVSFDFTNNEKLKESGFALEGKTVNGFVQGSSISINIDSAKALNAVVGHEITHVLEGTELYGELQEVLKQYAVAKGEYDSRLKALSKLYEGIEGADIEAELTADLVGDYIFTDADFVRRLSVDNPNLFQRLRNEIRHLYKMATAGSKEARTLEKAMHTFEQVYRESRNKSIEGSIRFSFGVTQEDVDAYVDAAYKNANTEPYKEYSEVSQKLVNDVAGEIDISDYSHVLRDNDIRHIRNSHGEGTNEKYPVTSEDIKKIPWLVENYDKVFVKTNANGVPGIVYVKVGKDNVIYYLEAVTDIYDGKKMLINKQMIKTGIDTIPNIYGLRTVIDKKEGSSQYLADLKQIRKAYVQDVKGNYLDYSVRGINENVKEKQLETINKHNPAPDTYHTWVRSVDDIKTFEEALMDDEYADYDEFNPDFDRAMAEKALEEGEITVYSSYPIEQGVFVSPSYMEAASYSGDGNVYSKRVPLESVAWIDITQGQYADTSLDGTSDQTPDDLPIRPSLSTEGQQDMGPVGNYNVYGRDVMLDGDIGPVREDIVTRQQETDGTHPITMEEYANNDAPIWKNVGYEDEATKSSITRQVHNEMVAAGSVVTVSQDTMQKVEESFPDLRSMKKKDRNPILKESFNRLKSNLRQFLGGISNHGFEFEVNGAILDAKLYGTGINEVLEKVNQEKAGMLYSTEEIFKNARYLYSTPDYDGDPNVYRWNYFYTPVQIGEQTVGVRIAVRDVINPSESQIYNWGIKKDTSLDGEGRGNNRISHDVSSDASTNIIPQNSENTTEIFSDQEDIGPVREVETSPMEDIGPIREDIKAPAKEPLEDIGPVREDIAPLPETEAAGKEETAEEPTGQQDVETLEEKYEAKLAATQTELDRNRQYRQESYDDFTKQIKEAQAKYDAKKNKNTKTANELLRSIEQMKRKRDGIDAEYAKRISDIEKRLAKMKEPTYKMAMQRKAKQQEYTELMKKLIGDTSTWVDKKLGISYKVNTLRRNLRDVVRDEKGNRDIAKADRIYEELQGKYNHNEAMLKRESNAIKKPYADMKITSAEDAYIQMLGEYKYNPDTELTAEVMQEYFEKHKEKIDVEKVDRIIEEARKTYDMLLARVNEVLREHGMKEIPYRQGYFPHFTDAKQGWLAKLFNWKTQKNEIPTDIAGMTENFKPNRSWQSFNKQRTSDITDYSFTQGLDTYVHGALDWIYHIEDIQKRRALENYIRYSHSEQGLKDKIDKIRNSEEYDADEMQEQIDLAYKEARNPLNNFVIDLRIQTNTLAAKKHSMDRGMEEHLNREVYSTITNISNRVTGNMVAGSISSALTNFIPITQSWGQVSPYYSLRAMSDTIRATFRDDGVVDKSDFLTNRLRGEENLHKGVWDKISEKVGFLMEAVDGFTSQTVWRSKYLQNISKGMSENEAIRNADQFAENVMAGRSRGNMPTIFDAKNPVIKAMTAFQLEVNNQYGYMFKDMPQDMQSESKGKLISGYVAMFVGAYAYNALYSSLTGRDSAFDPIGILEELLKDMGVFGGDDEEKKASDVMMGLTDNVLDELPFVSGIMGGGRIPISSVFPYGEGIYETVEGTLKDIDDKNWKKLTKEWLNPAWYLAIPVGGGQMRKTWQGLKMFDDDLPISGSYTDSGNLRFPVEDTVGNRIKAGIFGQYSSKNAREYFDRGEAPLNEKQIHEYKELEMSIQDYWDYRKGLKKLNSTEGTTLGDKVDYIAGLDASVKQKNIMVNNIAKREKKLDMSNYDMFEDFEEFDFYSKNPEKYTISKAIGGYKGYKKYTKALTDIEADKDKNGNDISGSVKKKRIAYINSLDALDYGQRIILYRSMYSSKEDKKKYNQDILDYLATRNDLSYKEKITILEELEFTINGDGTVSW